MINITICEDDKLQQKQLEDLIDSYINNHPDLPCKYKSFVNAEALLGYINFEKKFDIYLLDIVLPNMNGMELAKKIRNQDRKAVIIFITAEKEFALDAFGVQAFDYLVKPISKEKFYRLFDRISALYETAQPRSVFVKTPNGLENMYLDNLEYAEHSRRRILYHLNNLTTIESNTLRQPFSKEVEEIVQDERFIVCGPSFMVNLHLIKSIQKETIIFKSGEEIIPPKKYFNIIKEAWFNYWMK